MVKRLEEILEEPVDVIRQMASQAKLGRIVLAVGDEEIFYYVPSYGGKRSSISGRLRLRNVVRKRILHRKNYDDKDVVDLVYEQALKINEDLRGIRNPDGNLPNIAVVCLSDKVYDALNTQAETIDEPEDVLVKYQLKRYKQEDKPEVTFRLYKAPEIMAGIWKYVEMGKQLAGTPIGLIVDGVSLFYKVLNHLF